MAISFSRPDPSSPAAVSSAAFTVARRGYDQTEVRDFLRMVSAELARLQERERFLESELKAMQTRGLSAPGMLDEEVVTALLGEEAARVLTAAREASAQIRQRAEESATRLVKEAASDAARLREEAEIEAVRRRDDATADAEAEIELAKQQGREMVNEAREYREKVLSELARRRELARAQIEQLVANRDRLLNAFERARLATDDVMTGLVSVDDDLPTEFVNLAPTTGPVQPIVVEPAGTVVQMFDREQHDILEQHDNEAAAVTAAPIVEEFVGDDLIIDIPVGEAAAGDPEPYVESPMYEEVIVEETVEEEAVVEETVAEETAVDVVAIEEPVIDESIVVLEQPVIDEPVEQQPSNLEPSNLEPSNPEPSNVVSLFGKDRPRPEPVVVNPDHPSLDHSHVDKPVVVETPTPPRDAVDDIFARLRASSVSKPSEGTVVTPRSSKSDIAHVDKSTKSVPVVTAVRDDAAFALRDDTLQPLVAAMARKLKRVLADEENEALEYLRGKKPAISLEKMYGESGAHVAKYVAAITDDVVSAAQGGAAAVTDGKVKVKKADVLEVVNESVERLLVGPLRDKLATVLALHSADKTEAAKAVRGVYRQWKSTNIDEHIDDIACLSYSRGMYVTFAPGTQLCWMVDPNGPACADAEDNSLAGCVVRGDEFPTGHTQPLAHAGCRCLLAPMQH